MGYQSKDINGILVHRNRLYRTVSGSQHMNLSTKTIDTFAVIKFRKLRRAMAQQYTFHLPLKIYYWEPQAVSCAQSRRVSRSHVGSFPW